jgi:hypothetical protein
MPDASGSMTIPSHAVRRDETLPSFENPGRAFANGIMLALPLWGLVGFGIWAII